MNWSIKPKGRQERIAKGLWWDRALTLVEGCTNVSPACDHCWAESATAMRAKQTNPKIKARYEGLTNKKGKFNGTVRLQWEALKIPMRVKAPTRFAVWNDLFHKDVTDQFIRVALFMMDISPIHIFIVLTKRPDRAAEFISSQMAKGFTGRTSYPQNMILGTTVESPKYTYRIDELVRAPAAQRLISYEPALEYVDFRPWLEMDRLVYQGDKQSGFIDYAPLLHWLIMGCESGSNRRPMQIEWAHKVRKQCEEAGVAFFLKQMEVGGKVVGLPELDGKTCSEFPTGMTPESI